MSAMVRSSYIGRDGGNRDGTGIVSPCKASQGASEIRETSSVQDFCTGVEQRGHEENLRRSVLGTHSVKEKAEVERLPECRRLENAG
ncbi:hypothetical protein Naga_100287g1 [Nannochloropsis gaditana]|uniref:Uncharacterized protein n=1 Tax=Nannochloropsis gaditana TaxID=72520 RepID=W7U982_9STRA|nr:hypothetical protein Naga_100287g1 [Nannochloropsis gaditana]